MTSPVLAAGAVCWRIVDDTVRVLVIHREHRNDVSLPKGKVDPGESLPVAAVREVAEETGLAVALGQPLATTNYSLASGREKIVHYWAAHVGEKQIARSTFVPNKEVAAFEWLSITRARNALSYPRDVAVLDSFAAVAERGVASSFALIVLRHGEAVRAESWKESDSARPLVEAGERDASIACETIAAWGPRRLFSSTAERCRATIAPLSTLVGHTIDVMDAISQDTLGRDTARVRDLVGECIRERKTTVICSHQPVIPEIVREIARATGTRAHSRIDVSATLHTAGFSVFHLPHCDPSAGILGIETYNSDSPPSTIMRWPTD